MIPSEAMKYLSLLLLPLSVLCTSLTAVEYGYLSTETESNSVTLNDGDYIDFLGGQSIEVNDAIIITLPNGTSIPINNENLGLDYHSGGIGFLGTDSSKTFVGPCVITTSLKYLAYKLTRASEVEYKNINIVALPSANAGAGTHEIVVEASDDLQTWTPVHSSSIGGNKAFFRTRVVTNGE